ncbi:hypothetical protein [Clostridium magnum]|nr:hypothetical protein [Clostridium magnum]
MEAPPRFELGNKGFAVTFSALRLATPVSIRISPFVVFIKVLVYAVIIA